LTALPHGTDIWATSFVNFRDVDSIAEVGDLPAERQWEIFGGTYAPSLEFRLQGAETQFVAEHQDGQYPPSI
jgi:levansucrase